jgi:biopolymer transport protein ExbB
MRKTLTSFTARAALALLALAPAAAAQQSGAPAAAPKPAAGASFGGAAQAAEKQLSEALAELSRLREQMAQDTLPKSRALSELEAQLVQARQDNQDVVRLLDTRTLELSNLKTDIEGREGEVAYLGNLLGEYVRNFESRLHISELQRYAQPLEAAKLAPENGNLDAQQVFEQQSALLSVSLERLEDALSGARFPGTAVDASGTVRSGTFALLGPAGIFRSADGALVGTVEQRLGSLEPALVAYADPIDQAAAARVIESGNGAWPLDPTLGSAHKIAQTQETLVEHIQKGGPIMVPIFVLAGAALLVVLYKWLTIGFIRKPKRAQVDALLAAVARRDESAAREAAARIPGPAGAMVQAGVAQLGESRELIEEVMYESVLAARLRLQRMLPFVAISASAAPLLGLLGTVTGIMNTFTLMTVFGTGDVKTLSSGISEALITTEYGLIVAIPSLLLHALLSRKARGLVDQMEVVAVAFLNQLGKTPFKRFDASASASTPASLGGGKADERSKPRLQPAT